MSQLTQVQVPDPSEAAECELFEPEARGKDNAPQSNFYARSSKDSCLSELALRISSTASLDQALQYAVAALSEQLPNCSVRVEQLDAAQAPAEVMVVGKLGRECASSPGNYRTGETAGRCEWRLSEDSPGPVLVVTLEQIRQPREVARVIDLGDRVATLLGASVRRAKQHEALARQTQEILELRRRVIQAEKLASFGQLSASVLHDLSNPLTAILAYSDYLLRALAKAGVGADDLERLSRIAEAAEMVLMRTRGLVEYACPPRREPGKVDISAVVRRALVLCEHELERAGFSVELNLGNQLPAVQGQAEDLVQLFVNLFTNAAHAARPPNPRLRLEADVNESPTLVCVRVHDNGVGIQPHDLERVFDPFYTTSTDGGCGLGLSIVHDIVRQHHGRISVQSTPLEGTTFSLSLPAAST